MARIKRIRHVRQFNLQLTVVSVDQKNPRQIRGAKLKSASAFGVSAVVAVLAAVFIDEVGAACRAFLLLYFCAVLDVAFQCAGDAVLPCVDVVFIDVQVLHQSDDVLYRHSVAKHAGDEFRIVPVFLVE